MNRRLKRLFAVLLSPAILMLPTAADGLEATTGDGSIPAVPQTASPAPAEAPPGPLAALNEDVELERCLLTINFLYEPDTDRFSREGWLPTGYTAAQVANLRDPAAPLATNVNIWVFNCALARVGEGKSGPAKFTMAAIPVAGRPAHEHHPGMSDNYLVWVQTDRADIATSLQAAGIPASVVEDIDFNWRRGPLNPSEGLTGVQVPWATSPYEVGIRGVPGTDSPHHHDNTFRHVHARGTSTLEYGVLLPPGRDLLCVPKHRDVPADGWDGDPECGVKAAPGTDLARLLGDDPATPAFDPTARTGLAADHEVVWRSRLALKGA